MPGKPALGQSHTERIIYTAFGGLYIIGKLARRIYTGAGKRSDISSHRPSFHRI
jgi:hypothetical protein